MRQGYFLNSTCDMGINTQQSYAILAFLKIDRRHGEPLSRAPHVLACSCNIKCRLILIDQRQVTNQVCNKIRSHAHAVTDWIYCLEPPGSPWAQATGCPGVPGSKSSQVLHGRDFLIIFHHFSKQNRTFL